MFLAQYWRLETSSSPFYDFIKMTIDFTKMNRARFRARFDHFYNS